MCAYPYFDSDFVTETKEGNRSPDYEREASFLSIKENQCDLAMNYANGIELNLDPIIRITVANAAQVIRSEKLLKGEDLPSNGEKVKPHVNVVGLLALLEQLNFQHEPMQVRA